MDRFISNILTKIHHSLLVLDLGIIGGDRSCMKLRLSAKLSLKKTREKP